MKIVLITGAGSGFGLETTRWLANKGYYVIATVRSLERAGDLLNRKEENIEVLEMDVTDEAQVAKVRSNLEKTFGKLDVLINNAGYSQGGFLEYLSLDDWKKQFETNFFGVVQVTKTFLPFIRKSDKGKIINISSISGFFGFPGLAPYVSSKFALEGFSESLRLELKHEQISVSVVQPASFRTNIWKKGMESVPPMEHPLNYQKNLFKESTKSMEKGQDPSEVARIIGKICESSRPRFRYRVGKGARTLAFFKSVLPWYMVEWVVHKKLEE
ncbi:SDR family oxidoreductase [Fervidibacillus halotolerans]|uniref:SDR family oxidoreductase n=1 Tax=Fervidibacillus halotolerans TaxID=2980027 RepID=A0A9E8M1A2_9BACI|nr:SDR family oxidoreductase [Fervidibacillus halotolerans]WAA13341.1 SDR family oxidoreductase [Fervidibacillus halotolerans]